MIRKLVAPRRLIVLSLLLTVLPALAAETAGTLRHDLAVELIPADRLLRVTDRVALPPGAPGEFLLNAALTIRDSSPPVEELPLGDVAPFFGINAAPDAERRLELKRYRPRSAPPEGVLTLTYDGAFDFGLSDAREEYTRGFRETAGIVGPDGVYLAGDGFWYPRFDDGLIEFAIDVALPAGWHAISQGSGTSRDERGHARWDSGAAMEEIYLVGGPLQVWSDAAGAVEALVYLRERDDALASKYLTTTAQYVELYRNLIGPYPYGKFALVENFWETGYGMPSFTLLGPTVIRFPFILHSSYPHEILHNWWGNSVFVDYASGNWAEGLTAYLADHLVQEQRGKGEEHRRNTLQKYRNYVKQGRDFPLSEFRSRHSAATEAVGYGKTLMVFHMLRRQAGDEAFTRALQRFYREQRGRRASWDDLRTVFEGVTDEDLSWFFEQWVARPGAPSLALEVSEIDERDGRWSVLGSIRQVQPGQPYAIDLSVVLRTEVGEERAQVRFEDREMPFAMTVTARPLLLALDPQFDVFRQLDPREIPPSIGQIFGAPEVLAVLPSRAAAATREAYRALLEGWTSETHAIEIRSDTELPELPTDRAVWVLGRDNRFAGTLFGPAAVEGVDVETEAVTLGGERAPFSGHSLVAIRRHPGNVEQAIGWLVVDPLEAFPGMGRKLPHYGKYSYLAFEGDEPTNVIKGQGPASGSPLRVDLRPAHARAGRAPELEPERRRALAELPPVFSQRALMEHVARLAAPGMEGRGVGTAGLAAAAEYIAGEFERIGLVPGGDDGTYFQRFTVPRGPDGRPHEVANVIGTLPGTREEWREQSVVVSAHYDHLGRGWPDVHAGDEGRVHPGADDNASGVAVLLELAKNLADGERPARSLVFAAFAAEEAERLGSRHYVAAGRPFPLAGVRGVINLDTVGRLGDGKVSVLGTGTADEWQHIFRGSSFVTGVDSRNVPESAEASDQLSFIERGIPGVQIFTRAHEDHHRPGDTPDKVDGAGLVKVATFVKEGVAYLGEREEPLTVRIENAAATATAERAPAAGAPRSGRRVSFGTVPEFAFQGPGVRVDSVLPDSPAARAGLRAGDVLVRIDEHEIENLRRFSEVLRTLEPGQTVRATVERDGTPVTVDVTVVAR